MNLTLENIQRTVDQADRFMEANGADRQKRLGYRLLLEQLLLGYHDLYGEEISYRLVLKRTWKRVHIISASTVSPATCISRRRLTKTDTWPSPVRQTSRHAPVSRSTSH